MLADAEWTRSDLKDSEPAPLFSARLEVWLIIFAFLVIAVVSRWPNWWEWITPEAAPARELTTAMLVGVACLSAMQWRTDNNWRWLFVGAGFVALAADERLALHERVAEGVVTPQDIGLASLPWGQPDDMILVMVAVVGLAALPLIVPLLRTRPTFRRWFLIGVALSVAAVAMDTATAEASTVAADIWLRTVEEITELLAAGAFAHALLSQRPSEPWVVGDI